MQFLSYKVKNLFSVKEAALSLDKEGLVLVTGHSYDEGSSNGSGKSSLVNKGLLWALFGETAEGLKGDSVINNKVKNGSAYAEVIFKVKDDLFRIERTRDKKSGGTLTLEKNDFDLSKRDVRETQKDIERIIGRDLKSFIQTDFFGQGNSTPFMKLTPARQKEVLENILPFEDLDLWLENTKEAKKIVALELLSCKEQIKTYEANIQILDFQKTKMLGQEKNWGIENNRKIKELKTELATLENSDIANKIADTKAQLSKIETPNFEDKVSSFQSQVVEFSNKVNTLSSTLSTKERELAVLLQSQTTRTCPTCKQPLPQESQAVSSYELGALEKEIETIKLQRQKEQEFLTGSKINLRKLQEIRTDTNRLKALLISLNEAAHNEKIQKVKNQIQFVAESQNPYKETLKNIEIDKKENEKNLDLKNKSLQIIIEEESCIRLWEKAFSKDIKIMLYNKACPFITKKANHYLNMLRNPQITVNFSTTKTLKNDASKTEFTTAASSTTGGSEYDLLSGGEQQMVDFSVGMALSDLASTQIQSKTNLLVLDEPFVGLDNRNSEAIVQFLTEISSKTKDTVFLISNEESLKGLIPNIIRLEKTNGCSTLVRC